MTTTKIPATTKVVCDRCGRSVIDQFESGMSLSGSAWRGCGEAGISVDFDFCGECDRSFHEWREGTKPVIQEQADEINRLMEENKLHRIKANGDYWAWQNGEENHLHSLVCPILIDAYELRELIAKAVPNAD